MDWALQSLEGSQVTVSNVPIRPLCSAPLPPLGSNYIIFRSEHSSHGTSLLPETQQGQGHPSSSPSPSLLPALFLRVASPPPSHLPWKPEGCPLFKMPPSPSTSRAQAFRSTSPPALTNRTALGAPAPGPTPQHTALTLPASCRIPEGRGQSTVSVTLPCPPRLHSLPHRSQPAGG